MNLLAQILIFIVLIGHPAQGTELKVVATPQPKPEVLAVSYQSNQILEAVNQKRVARGLAPLAYSQKIANGAYIRARSLAKKNQWSHDGLAQALWNAGLRDWYSENLARNFGSDYEIVDGWVNSPSHAEKMFDSRCTQAGVGKYGTYVVLWMGICGQP